MRKKLTLVYFTCSLAFNLPVSLPTVKVLVQSDCKAITGTRSSTLTNSRADYNFFFSMREIVNNDHFNSLQE